MDPLRFLARVLFEHAPRLTPEPAPLRDLMEHRLGLTSSRGLVSFGTLPANGERPEARLLLAHDEATSGHGLVVGASGSGKTMLALAMADAAARAGAVVVLVSPHPDLIAGGRALAARHRRPLVALDFSGRSSLVTPFSLFSKSAGRPDELAHLIVSLFATAMGGGQTAGVIRGALHPILHVLATYPDQLTLLEADRLVHDSAFAAPFVDDLESPLPSVVQFFHSLRGKGRAAVVMGARYALARLHALMAYRGARLTLCARPAVDLRQVLRTPCVVTVDVPAATLGESSGLLAGLVVEQLRLLLMQRTVPQTAEPPVVLFVDELGSMIAHVEHLAAFLAQSRKWRASLVGLVQSTSQLEAGSRLLDAFLANAGLLALGRLGASDARRFASLAASLPHRSKLHAEGAVLEGRELRFAKQDETLAPVREAEAIKTLTTLPTRMFVTRLGLDGQVHVALMQAHDVDWLDVNARPTLLGARPLQEVEAEVQARLRVSDAARPESLHAKRTAERSSDPPAPATRSPDAPTPKTQPLPPITPKLKNRI